MASQTKQLHFVFVPLMAQGHIIPMVDMARLFTKRGVTVSIVTTPLNAIRFEEVIGRAKESGQQIQIIQLHFPCLEAGLSEGCENLDMLPSQSSLPNFFVAAAMLQQPMEALLAELTPPPSCIISDVSFAWTNNVAQKFQIPRLVFHGTGCFPLLCIENLLKYRVFETLKSDSEYFVVPGLPDSIELTRAQLPGFANPSVPGMNNLQEQMREAERNSYGILANTFEELEMDYIQEFRKVKNTRVWCIGPVSLCNEDNLDKAERGKKASIDEHRCLKWLGLQEPKSVIYACLGSQSRLASRQMIELALGLEASQRPFIWALRYKADEFENWLSEERFEERIRERGLLINGWAPQLLILTHPAIGGFLTHCGWNSTLEGISAGVPMIAWPIFAEQFCNEKLIVNVLRTGITVGVEIPVRFGEEEKIGVQVNKTEIKAVIHRLMDEGKEGEEMRERARLLREMAERALEEGGSSYLNMTLLIQDIMKHADNRRLAEEYK